jgi:hypothetical protein
MIKKRAPGQKATVAKLPFCLILGPSGGVVSVNDGSFHTDSRETLQNLLLPHLRGELLRQPAAGDATLSASCSLQLAKISVPLLRSLAAGRISQTG